MFRLMMSSLTAAIVIGLVGAVPAIAETLCPSQISRSQLGFEDGLAGWTVTGVADQLDTVGSDQGVVPPQGSSMLRLGQPRGVDDPQPPGPNTICATVTADGIIAGWLRVVSYDAADRDLGDFDGVSIALRDADGTIVDSVTAGPAGETPGSLSDTDWVPFELDGDALAGTLGTLTVTGGGTRDRLYPTIAYVDFDPVDSFGGDAGSGGGTAPGSGDVDSLGDEPASDSYLAPESIGSACDARDGTDTFPDISSSVHRAAIECASAGWDVARGYADGTYGPADEITRGQLATFVVRLVDAAGLELPGTPDDAFDDDDGSTHEAAIDRLAAAGILRGVSEGRVAPAAFVTRAQAASYLTNTWDVVTTTQLPTPPASPFADVGGVHAANIDRAAAAGFIQGRTATTYEPESSLTRGQMASLLMRFAAALVINEGVEGDR